jgi:anti-sigma B factor antagonist
MTNFMNESTLRARVGREEWAGSLSVLHVQGALRAPVRADLRRRVRGLLARGRRRILLDLAKVTDLDAAGVGEIVRIYTLANAAQGDLWIENAAGRTRRLLDHAGLFDLLSMRLLAYERCS